MRTCPGKLHPALLLAVGALTLTLCGATAARAQCVGGSTATTMPYFVNSTTGTAYSPVNLNLANGLYYYNYTTSGGSFLQNIFAVVNGISWQPNAYLQVIQPSNIGFNFYVPNPSTPPCSTQTIRFKFYDLLGQLVCTYNLTVVLVENSDGKNMTFVNGVSKAYYAGGDFKAHVLTWGSPVASQWNYSAVNPTSGWGPVQIAGQMASFADGSRVFFKGRDQRLYNLVSSGSTWTLSLVKPGLPNVGGKVAARGNNEVVFYDVSGKIRRLLLTGGVWNDQIINTGTGAIYGQSISLPPGSSDIFFAYSNGSIRRAYPSGSTWLFEQVCPAGSGAGGYGNASEMLVTESNAVYYRGQGDARVHRYTKTGSAWSYEAMSPASDPNVNVSGYLTKFPGEERVFYKSTGGRVYNIYKQGGVWYNWALNYGVGGGGGDLLAAEEKIFYVNQDRRVHNFYWTGKIWWDDVLSRSGQADTKSCLYSYMR
ncbi:MAG TPA: hypothetical protein VEY09_07155 [Pyrinomonadaceae bacterium]|nr:hypothetical protein [Pyrinomonadaceae bacterium]